MQVATEEQRAEWRAAAHVWAEVYGRRQEILKPIEAEYQAAKDRLEEIEAEIGAPILCEACARPIFDADPYLGGETPMCGTCAPTYDLLLTESLGFVDADGEQLTPQACRDLYDRHIAAGGKPTDSMATVFAPKSRS